jgi:hypothetical protein
MSALPWLLLAEPLAEEFGRCFAGAGLVSGYAGGPHGD